MKTMKLMLTCVVSMQLQLFAADQALVVPGEAPVNASASWETLGLVQLHTSAAGDILEDHHFERGVQKLRVLLDRITPDNLSDCAFEDLEELIDEYVSIYSFELLSKLYINGQSLQGLLQLYDNESRFYDEEATRALALKAGNGELRVSALDGGALREGDPFGGADLCGVAELFRCLGETGNAITVLNRVVATKGAGYSEFEDEWSYNGALEQLKSLQGMNEEDHTLVEGQ